MERNFTATMTDQLERQFRSSIEGIIPDLCECDTESGPTVEDKDSIYDYAADRASDTFPNLPHEERTALAERVASYFCGGI